MVKRIVLLSGSVSAGKSTLAARLSGQFGMSVLKTGELLIPRLRRGQEPNRRALQEEGDALDRATGGSWVAEELSRRAASLLQDAAIVVDAVRIAEQVECVRRAYGPRVVHVHLTAPPRTLARRYTRRAREKGELPSYDDVQRNATERSVEGLADIADIVIDTNTSTAEDVVVRAASHLGLYPSDGRLVDVVVGGQFGSEGKGNIVAYLSREYDILLRVGGPNAGHTVCLDKGKYVHHQLPSGTLTTNANLMIGPGAVINVKKLMQEISDCNVDAGRLRIDPNATIISAADMVAEKRLVAAIGSTGQGGGAATARRIMKRGDAGVVLAGECRELKPYVEAIGPLLDSAFAHHERVLLEGTQGTGLSLYHGSYPHVTSRDTTAAGCLAEAGVPPSRVRRVVMVCRTYPIRVQSPAGGSSGPMSGEISLTEISRRSGLSISQLRGTEKTSTTGRKRRVAEFDWALLRRATSLNGPTDIALTFADYLSKDNERARRFEQLTPDTIRFVEEIERVAKAPVSLVSTRFHPRGIIDRRSW